MNEKRLDQVRVSMLQHLTKTPMASGKALAKIIPEGHPKDSFAREEWVPPQWSAAGDGMQPAGLSTYGSPWMVVDQTRTWRCLSHETATWPALASCGSSAGATARWSCCQ